MIFAPSNSTFHFFKFYLFFNQAHSLLFFTSDNVFLLREFFTSDLKVSWTFLDTILTFPQHHKFSSFFNSQFLEDLFPFCFISGFFLLLQFLSRLLFFVLQVLKVFNSTSILIYSCYFCLFQFCCYKLTLVALIFFNNFCSSSIYLYISKSKFRSFFLFSVFF
jgi:hypothetical protein